MFLRMKVVICRRWFIVFNDHSQKLKQLDSAYRDLGLEKYLLCCAFMSFINEICWFLVTCLLTLNTHRACSMICTMSNSM